MTRLSRFFASGLLGLMVLATSLSGCSSDNTFCGKLAAAACANVMTCCDSSARETLLGEENVNDEGRCKMDVKLKCEESYVNYLYAVDQGTVTYHEDAAKTCFDAYKKPSDKDCVYEVETSPFPEDCFSAIFTGNVGSGSDCRWTFECSGTSFCNSSTGKCVPYAQEGEDCGDVSCAEGLYCNSSTKCAARLSAGTACTSSSMCQEDLFCDTTCKALASEGEACTSDSSCDSGDCLDGTCENGDTCNDYYSCDDGHCAAHTATSCSSDYECSYCSVSGDSCYYSCTDSTEECLDDTCVTNCGGRVCGPKALVKIDFCAISTSML